MLKNNMQNEIKTIIEQFKTGGWVSEPDAKKIMQLAGLDIPKFILTDSVKQAADFLKNAEKPVVAKAVSEKIMHKTEHKAVVTGIDSVEKLEKEMNRLLTLEGCKSVLVEEMIQGIEVIVGAKVDFQFGPVVVLGLGGTLVEIYNDTAIRMAPLKPNDASSMINSLKAKALLLGYRGKQGVNTEVLINTLVSFSYLIMELENSMESLDLNPVICTKDRCVIADARIILSD
jgi:acetate---CoA ligase (ADP-forming) subunit beta